MAHPTDSIVGAMRSPSPEDRALIARAYDIAEKAHGDEKRKSGEPYITHPLSIALHLAEIGMDRDTVIAGILHDTLEDTALTATDIEKEFGTSVRQLVEGVTKLSKLKYRGLERTIGSLRRLILATADDPRTIIIKLADRLHNMETIRHHSEPEKIARIARETMRVYVPIAESLNIGYFKKRLEDLAFEVLEPVEFKKTKALFEKQRSDLNKDLEEALREIKKIIASTGIKNFRTERRIKGIRSFWRKLNLKGGDTDKVFDVLAARVIVSTVDECYQALAAVHREGNPVPDQVRDFVSRPKDNGYRSIHTAVVTKTGMVMSLHILTEEMHYVNEYGSASHFSYKFGESRDSAQREAAVTFFKERFFAFTPKGDVIDLPSGATPVDFAYAVHSSLGNSMVGAKINGKLVSLETPIKNGDIVEVVTKKNGKPNKKWLEFAKTSGAKKHIRSALKLPPPR